MRIRTIKPEFFLHSALFDAEESLGLPIRLAFVGLWCASDREGRFKWRPRELKLQILPYDSVDFSRVLDALLTRGFIEKYASNGQEYGWIPSFLRHQVINNRERESELPDPCDPSVSTRAPRVDDACPTRLVRAQVEGKGREGNKEGKGTEEEHGVTTPEAPQSVSSHEGIAQPIKTPPRPVSQRLQLGEWEVAAGVLIPDRFRTPKCKEAIFAWLEYKREKRQAYKPRGLKALMESIEVEFSPETLPEAVRKSCAANWQGLFPSKNNGNHSTGSGRTHRNDFIGGGDIWDAQVAHDIATRPEGFGVQTQAPRTVSGVADADPGS